MGAAGAGGLALFLKQSVNITPRIDNRGNGDNFCFRIVSMKNEMVSKNKTTISVVEFATRQRKFPQSLAALLQSGNIFSSGFGTIRRDVIKNGRKVVKRLIQPNDLSRHNGASIRRTQHLTA